MPTFRDAEAAARAFARLSEVAGQSVDDFVRAAVRDNAAPDLALTNFERWAGATGNPGLQVAHVAEVPSRAPLLFAILGASQPLADALIQNPELASLVLEPGEIGTPATVEEIVAEGRKLLAAATSQAHALDRLRYLRQRHILPITVADLSGLWEQEVVWHALSDLAEATIRLTIEATWPAFARLKALDESRPPLGVVAFGKLGGRELNYSSDVDLVYVAEDDIDERMERELARYCEALGRALSDRMGRGSLYRVDLRLRPYGAAGSIVRKAQSVEAYYRLYAEPWEAQAALRSRVVAGDWLTNRWEGLVTEVAFPAALGEPVLRDMAATRVRIEEIAQGDDLKRGRGGIRDAEFLVQSLQMVYGHGDPSLRVRGTCDAARALAHAGVLEVGAARALVDGYTFLRKLEHRLQLVGDQQTHTMPEDEERRTALARTMGLRDAGELDRALENHRRTVAVLYRTILRLEGSTNETDPRSAVAAQAGPQGAALLAWFDGLPASEAFYESLRDNEGSLGRVLRVLSDAPRLGASLRASLPLTEALMSGEIEEEGPARLDNLGPDPSDEAIATAALADFTAACVGWVLHDGFPLERSLTDVGDRLVRLVAEDGLAVIALGSFGLEATTPGSDLDLLLLTVDDQTEAERAAQNLLNRFERLGRLGSPFRMDLRLRPEGRKGLLVRSLNGFLNYAARDMESWERFALGHARLLAGPAKALDAVRMVARERPLDAAELKELRKMKRRIETERVRPAHVARDVKLGKGGLSDIEWLVRLTEMVYPGARAAESALPPRIEALTRAGHFNVFERDMLLGALRWLLDLRHRLWLLDIPDDVLPENPERLGRLARALGQPDPNELLRHHARITGGVRDLFETGVARLQP